MRSTALWGKSGRTPGRCPPPALSREFLGMMRTDTPAEFATVLKRGTMRSQVHHVTSRIATNEAPSLHSLVTATRITQRKPKTLRTFARHTKSVIDLYRDATGRAP